MNYMYIEIYIFFKKDMINVYNIFFWMLLKILGVGFLWFKVFVNFVIK